MIVVTVARKPLPSGETVASNSLRHGCGAVNVDGSRIGTPEDKRAAGTRAYVHGRHAGGYDGTAPLQAAPHDGKGRWPANLVLGQQAAEALDQQAGHLVSGKPTGTKRGDKRDEDAYGDMNARFGGVPVTGYGDEGGASRFFKRVR